MQKTGRKRGRGIGKYFLKDVILGWVLKKVEFCNGIMIRENTVLKGNDRIDLALSSSFPPSLGVHFVRKSKQHEKSVCVGVHQIHFGWRPLYRT